MGKIIEETFTKIIDRTDFYVIARNYNKHYLRFFNSGTACEVALTTDELRDLGNHLIDSANKIDADPDFNQKK